ncbi:MAG: glycoside hydrolase family 3 N-terminal domain-containing protein [Pseudomonadales bacterium]
MSKRGADQTRAPYRDPERDLDARIKDLLGRMTLREKVCQLGGAWSSALVGENGFDPERAAPLLADGIGQITRIGAASGLTPDASARLANAVQRYLVAETRLGIPAIVHEEALAGYCARGATQYPQAIGLAATWWPEGVRTMAEAIRGELMAVGARQALAPVLDIARDPRWGRLEETYGEDAYLAGRMGVAFVRGLQTGDLRGGVLATAKHFVGYGLPEGGMNHAPVHLGPRELREVFAEPFAAAIRDAGLRSVMNSYSAVDGVAPAASGELLDELLRGELGFEGLVVADYFAVDLLVRHHAVARDKAAAAALALSAGLDVELPALDCYGELEGLVEGGRLDVALIDRAVRRVLRVKFELGLFEAPYVDEAAAAAAFDPPASREHARRLAEQSLVLLENDGVLPLARGGRVALFGPAADDARLLLGDYHYPAHAEIVYRRDELDTGITPAARGGGDDFRPGPYYVDIVTPLAGISAFAEVAYERGCEVGGDDDAGLAAAVSAARNADVAVICIGGRSGLMPDCTSGEFRDSATLRLTGVQSRLLAEVAATGTPVVLVVIGGRALALEAEIAACNAVVLAWLPGEEGGAALARVLFGEVNPAGRLPVSLPRSAGQVPAYYNHRSGGGRSMALGDYIDQSTRPLYAFGHGLSYSRFEYVDLACPDTVDVHATVNLWVTLRNDSDRDGEEVVQVYLRDKVADVARPVRKLAGFKRVAVPAGKAVRLKFMVDTSQLGYYDRQMRFVVDPGEVEIQVGASSRDIRLRGVVVLQGERRPLSQKQVVATLVEVKEVEVKTVEDKPA